MTISSLAMRPTAWLGRAFAAVYLLILIVVCGYLIINGPELHAGLEAKKALVVNQEDRAFCGKLGAGSETGRFAECSAGLREIRAHQDQRNADPLF